MVPLTFHTSTGCQYMLAEPTRNRRRRQENIVNSATIDYRFRWPRIWIQTATHIVSEIVLHK